MSGWELCTHTHSLLISRLLCASESRPLSGVLYNIYVSLRLQRSLELTELQPLPVGGGVLLQHQQKVNELPDESSESSGCHFHTALDSARGFFLPGRKSCCECLLSTRLERSTRGIGVCCSCTEAFPAIPADLNISDLSKPLTQSSRGEVNPPFGTWIAPTAHPALPLQHFKHLGWAGPASLHLHPPCQDPEGLKETCKVTGEERC